MNNGLFAERLTTALMNKGMSQYQLAKLVGTNAQTINKYYKGLRTPRKDVLVRMARVLGVSPSWLIGLDSKMENPVRAEIDKRLDDMTEEQLSKLLRFIEDYM